jgi:hypothetical protein
MSDAQLRRAVKRLGIAERCIRRAYMEEHKLKNGFEDEMVTRDLLRYVIHLGKHISLRRNSRSALRSARRRLKCLQSAMKPMVNV